MASIRIDNNNILIFYSKDDNFFEINVNADDRVTDDNLRLFSYDAGLKKIVYLPDITPVNRTISMVEYDWQENTVSIYLNDIYRTKPYVFPVVQNMSEQDCVDLINKYTDEQLKNYDL